MLSRLGLLAGAAALLSGCAQGQSLRLEQQTATLALAWPDECSQLPGYAAFRQKLERAVTLRNTSEFIALLHPRLTSKASKAAGGSDDYRWLFGRYGAETAWSELQELLEFGCVQHGDKLLLPAMAKLVQDMSVDPEYDVTIKRVVVRTEPDASASVLRAFDQGELVRTVTHGSPPGWVAVLVNEQKGFVQAADIRSPHDFQLELTMENGRWYVYDFGSGV